MFPLAFHYENVLRQDPLLKSNYANVLEVPGFSEIRIVQMKGPSLQKGKMALEISSGQKCHQRQRAEAVQEWKSARKEPEASDLAPESTLRGHGMASLWIRISTVMSLFDSAVEIRAKAIPFSMEREFCECSPELEDHFQIFEEIRGFHLTILTSANTQDETLPPWSGFHHKEEGKNQDSG